MRTYDRHYIDGRWASPSGGCGVLEVVDSATEEVIGHGPAGTAADAGAAVEAAHRAWPAWAQTPATERGQLLRAVARRLGDQLAELSELFSREVGIIHPMAVAYQQVAVSLLPSHADLAASYPWQVAGEDCTLLREPVGVVAAVIPWNYPLLVALAKVAPALAAGCTVVLKPSEVTPLTGFMLAEAADVAGLPPGVLNVVGGTGPEVGAALVSDPRLDAVSFTGSTRVGREISAVAGQTIKRVSLELGGKSPCVVLDDADLEAAVKTAMTFVTENAGQGCGALSRLVVPRCRVAEAEEMAAEFCRASVVGDPFGAATTIGALASAEHHERVTGYIRRGISDGLRLVSGGPERPDGLDRGYFVRPTVFTSDDPATPLAQEEIFGPVELIIPHDGDEDALRIANSTIYGLAASVFCRDPERADRMASRIRAGHVDINGYAVVMSKPWGGYKQSGIGRQNVAHGFEEFL